MQFQFSSVQSLSHVWLCNPTGCSPPGFPVHPQLLEFPQTHAHWVSDVIQPSQPLSSPSPPALNLSQHQSLFQWVILLPGKSHGPRSLVGCSPWGLEESDMTEWLHFHVSLLCIGEGNGNPLQCSCVENPRDRVSQSQTRLKWLSSSSNTSSLHQVAEVLEFQL